MKTGRHNANNLKSHVVTLAALALVLSLPGCGTDGSAGSALTAPAFSSNGSIQVVDGADGSNSSGGFGDGTSIPVGDHTPAPDAGPGLSATITGEAIETSLAIGKSGGTIVAGRHTLRILPNTFPSPTLVTLRDLTGVSGRVECEILPAGLGLNKQAHLTSNFADLASPAGFGLFEVANAGTPDESWLSVDSAPTSNGQGLLGHIHTFARFAPSAVTP